MDQAPVDPRDSRRAPRDSLFLHATMQREGEAEVHQMRVRNLSTHGMMAEIGAPFEAGDRVEIDLRGIGEVEGFVVWQVEQRVGVAFSVPIDPRLARKSVAVRSVAKPVAVTPPAPRRPKLFGK